MSVLFTGRFSGIGAGTRTGARSRRAAYGVLGVVVAIVAGLAVPSSASAATNSVYVGVVPEFPTRVDLGATNVPASLLIINSSAGAEATGSLTVTDLTLVPSCGNYTPTCAGAADPGVFELSAKGTGAAGTNCAHESFDLTVVDRSTGRVRFATSDRSPLLLGPSDISNELDICRIHFTLSSLAAPDIDSLPNVGEPQTNQIGFMSVRHGNGNTGTDQGEDVTTLVADGKYARWLDRSFRDLIGRNPNSDETRHWVTALTGGQQTRASLARMIVVSTEYRNYMVNRYFNIYLNRDATATELADHALHITNGWPFQFSEGWVLGSDEFFARHGSSLINYAEVLFRKVLGTAPDPSGVVWLVDQMARGAPRFSVAVAFTTYWAVHDGLAAEAAPWFLRRAATAAEVDQWSRQLDGGSRLEHLYADLVSSDEYWSQV